MTGDNTADSCRPIGMTLNRESREFHIKWSDGHTSVYDFDSLRAACPCAVCKQERQNPSTLETNQQDINIIQLTPVQAYRLVDVEQVGRYAIQLIWSDGHQAGIYPWELLRTLDASAPSPDDPT